MIQASWVWLACVLRAMSGSATFSDAIAETTAARATQTTAVTAPWPAWRRVGEAAVRIGISLPADSSSLLKSDDGTTGDRFQL